MLDLPLRPFQVTARDKAIRLKRCPIIAPMGSGKTRIAYEALNEFNMDQRVEPVVIICPKNAVATWIEEGKKWLGVDELDFYIASGKGTSPEKRRQLWLASHRLGYTFYITTYASFKNDYRFIPRSNPAVIMDEPHRYIRNRTKMWKHLVSWTLRTEVMYLVDGTPMRKGPQDLFTYFHLCNRKRFSKYWQYVNTWCLVIDGMFGKEILGAKNMTNFKKHVYLPNAAYVSNAEADKYLPKKNAIAVPLEVTPTQRIMLTQLEEEMYLEVGDRIILAPQQMTVMLRHRQILTCPMILHPDAGIGAGMEWIIDHISESEVVRPVIFTPFVACMEFLREYTQAQVGKSRKVHTIQGGMEYEELRDIIKEFTDSDDDVMICSLTYAESFEFHTSSVAYFLGYDWSWDVNAQAQDRLRRLTNENPHLTYYFLKHRNTIDGRILERMFDKKRNVKLVTPALVREIVNEQRNRAA